MKNEIYSRCSLVVRFTGTNTISQGNDILMRRLDTRHKGVWLSFLCPIVQDNSSYEIERTCKLGSKGPVQDCVSAKRAGFILKSPLFGATPDPSSYENHDFQVPVKQLTVVEACLSRFQLTVAPLAVCMKETSSQNGTLIFDSSI